METPKTSLTPMCRRGLWRVRLPFGDVRDPLGSDYGRSSYSDFGPTLPSPLRALSRRPSRETTVGPLSEPTPRGRKIRRGRKSCGTVGPQGRLHRADRGFRGLR